MSKEEVLKEFFKEFFKEVIYLIFAVIYLKRLDNLNNQLAQYDEVNIITSVKIITYNNSEPIVFILEAFILLCIGLKLIIMRINDLKNDYGNKTMNKVTIGVLIVLIVLIIVFINNPILRAFMVVLSTFIIYNKLS